MKEPVRKKKASNSFQLVLKLFNAYNATLSGRRLAEIILVSLIYITKLLLYPPHHTGLTMVWPKVTLI